MIEYFKTQHLIESMVSERIVPGVNYTFIKGDQVFSSTVGFSSLLPKENQLNPFSLYDLASLTKVLGTTNVLLKLKEEGKISFSDSLSDYLPEFKDPRVKLSHLLTHTSGIRGWIENRDSLSAPDLLLAIQHLPVTDEFETKMRYADTNFILLGLVIEKVCGRPVQDVITDMVLKPLNRDDITFSPEPAECIPTAMMPNGQILQGIVHDPKARILGKDCGSAGLFGSLDALITMSESYLGRTTNALPLKQETIADLFSVKTPKGVHARSWGWDLRFDPKDKHPLIFHTGFTGTFILLDRLNKSGLIVLTNRIHPSGHNQIFLAMREVIVNTFLKENVVPDNLVHRR